MDKENMKEIYNEIIKEYKKFETLSIFTHADEFYQKRVLDKDEKTKYFIDAYIYDRNKNLNIELEIYFQKANYSMKIQLYAIELNNLKQIEEQIEKVWIGIGSPYYEYDE